LSQPQINANSRESLRSCAAGNDALREFIARSREPLESTLRRVIREEIRRVG
jgi:hypothetical protein